MRFVETLASFKKQARNPPKLMHLRFLFQQAGGSKKF